MNVSIQEFADSRGVPLRADATAGILRGVKVLGLVSRNGRYYAPQALAAAVALYEGAKVNVNHPKGHPLSARDYQDRIGVLRAVRLREGEGLFAELHFNPHHPLADQLVWDAQHAPENVGFSHNVLAQVARRAGREVVEAITHVQSVDLVADPATTRGLFESAADGSPPPEATPPAADSPATLAAPPAPAADPQRAAVVRRLLAEFRLPDPRFDGPWAHLAVDAAWLAALEAAADEPAARRMVVERLAQLQALADFMHRAAPTHQPLARE